MPIVWNLANEFAIASRLLSDMYETKDSNDNIALLAIETVSARANSASSTRRIVRRVYGLLKFYIGLGGGGG